MTLTVVIKLVKTLVRTNKTRFSLKRSLNVLFSLYARFNVSLYCSFYDSFYCLPQHLQSSHTLLFVIVHLYSSVACRRQSRFFLCRARAFSVVLVLRPLSIGLSSEWMIPLCVHPFYSSFYGSRFIHRFMSRVITKGELVLFTRKNCRFIRVIRYNARFTLNVLTP